MSETRVLLLHASEFHESSSDSEDDFLGEFIQKYSPVHLNRTKYFLFSIEFLNGFIIIILAQTLEIGQGLGRFLSCGARKPEQT